MGMYDVSLLSKVIKGENCGSLCWAIPVEAWGNEECLEGSTAASDGAWALSLESGGGTVAYDGPSLLDPTLAPELVVPLCPSPFLVSP
jgi:hypothetical protein